MRDRTTRAAGKRARKPAAKGRSKATRPSVRVTTFDGMRAWLKWCQDELDRSGQPVFAHAARLACRRAGRAVPVWAEKAIDSEAHERIRDADGAIGGTECEACPHSDPNKSVERAILARSRRRFDAVARAWMLNVVITAARGDDPSSPAVVPWRGFRVSPKHLPTHLREALRTLRRGTPDAVHSELDHPKPSRRR
jgi:hypothetical protein